MRVYVAAVVIYRAVRCHPSCVVSFVLTPVWYAMETGAVSDADGSDAHVETREGIAICPATSRVHNLLFPL